MDQIRTSVGSVTSTEEHNSQLSAASSSHLEHLANAITFGFGAAGVLSGLLFALLFAASERASRDEERRRAQKKRAHGAAVVRGQPVPDEGGLVAA